MAVISWNVTTIDGKQWLVVDLAKFRIPLEWDPSSNMFLAIAVPDGGIGNFPALVKGDDGDATEIDTTINFTALDFDDPDPEFASFTEISPGVLQLNLGLRNGAPGDDGDTVLNPDDFDDVLPGKMIVVNPDGDGFVLQTQKVGNRYWPATIISCPSGNPTWTLAVVGIESADFPRYVKAFGGAIAVGTSSDVRVDLRARLDGESAGNIIGRALGQTGTNPAPMTMIPRTNPGAAGDYDYINAGETATVHLRAERIAGTGTFTISNTDVDFYVETSAVP